MQQLKFSQLRHIFKTRNPGNSRESHYSHTLNLSFFTSNFLRLAKERYFYALRCFSKNAFT